MTCKHWNAGMAATSEERCPYCEIEAEIESERSKVKRLVEFLRHDSKCGYHVSGICNCGLDELLTELGEG